MRYLILSIGLVTVWPACQPEPRVVSTETMCAGDSTESSELDSLDLFVVEGIDLVPEALGKFTRSIAATNEEAMQFFDQGMQLKYAFAVNEAASSFREAQRRDPDCAICYWGEAWALGSYLNGHMPEEKAPLALAAIDKAAELVSESTPKVEKALIEAMQVRYIEDYVFDERKTRDTMFAEAMRAVFERFPDDADVGTVYAEALFLLEPRGGTRELDDPDVMRIHEVLEGVLTLDITHPGACHLYIHATESTPNPGLAESCANILGDAIPGASHIQHMPSHTFNELGRWGDAVRANLNAWHTDQRAAENGTAFAIYAGHNLHMLLYAACYDGQGAIAMQASKEYYQEHGSNMHHVLTLTRFGRFDEVLEQIERPEEIAPGSIWDFCQGYAKLRMGDVDFAKLYLERVKTVADTTTVNLRYSKAGPVLKVLASILEGEIAYTAGKTRAAVRDFERAVRIEDDLSYSEPEPLPFAARQWLGATLLETGRYERAERVFREELEDHPHNGWSLFGLIEALKAQGKSYDTEQADFDESWARADIWLASSRF